MQPGKFVVLIIFFAAILLVGCDDDIKLQSQWTEPITLSEINDDWPESPQYFDKGSSVLVSVMNDDDNLYVRLLTKKQTTRMMFMRAGFTVWFDNSGNTRKNFGLQFPVARQSHMQGGMPDHKSGNRMEEMLAEIQYSLAILNGPEETRQTMPKSKAAEMGIYASLRMDRGYLIYELKIPLSIAGDSRTIGIGFETGKIESGSGKRASGGGRGGMGGGKGGRGGKGGKKMGGKGGGHGGGNLKPIEIWARIHLAENPSSKDNRNIKKN